MSFEIMRDGLVTTALAGLLDRRPQKLGKADLDPLPEKLTAFLRQQDWIEDVVVRIREKGREFVAGGMVVPRRETNHLAKNRGDAPRR